MTASVPSKNLATSSAAVAQNAYLVSAGHPALVGSSAKARPLADHISNLADSGRDSPTGSKFNLSRNTVAIRSACPGVCGERSTKIDQLLDEYKLGSARFFGGASDQYPDQCIWEDQPLGRMEGIMPAVPIDFLAPQLAKFRAELAITPAALGQIVELIREHPDFGDYEAGIAARNLLSLAVLHLTGVDVYAEYDSNKEWERQLAVVNRDASEVLFYLHSAAAPPPSAAAIAAYALPAADPALLAQCTVAYHPASDRRLVLVVAPDKPTLDVLLLRASIFYEHPDLRTQYLDATAFAAAQAQRGKPFTYYGHNMTLDSLCAFLTAAGNAAGTSGRSSGSGLLAGETHLLRSLTKIKAVTAAKTVTRGATAQYLVGWVRGDTATLQHELHHAWFFFNAAGYRETCAAALASLDTMLRLQVRAYLVGCGYCEAVWVDEFQAHLCCGDAMVLGKGMAVMAPALRLIEEAKRDGGGEPWFEDLEVTARGEF
ncbi:hypothetical protein H9P43_004750 [Blastocladiella emersonii ATCC 22665]|nr:hypothetical protein H9P43_004750 [Blastocladiella emersonii ATCC 22665]